MRRDSSDSWQANAIIGLALAVGVALCFWGYTRPLTPIFYAGILLLIAGFGPMSFRLGYRRWPLGALRASISAFVLLIVFLGFEIAWAVYARLPEDQSWKEKVSFSYDEARADLDGFRRWWNYNSANFFDDSYLMKDASGTQPYVLAPGARSAIFDSAVAINSLGFRGPEIERAKGQNFRIVALGESTTFGATAHEEDRPWPELLEEMIRNRLECNRPVQVINAGVPGWSLANQLNRLPTEILPLEPDVLLSYHGYNGFHFLFASLPEMLGEAVPEVGPRPSRLLATVENALRIRRIRDQYRQVEQIDARTVKERLNESAYANLYRKLNDFSKTHRLALVLSTFNMSVDADSPEEAVRLYEETFPDVRSRIAANRLHNELIREMGRLPGVLAIDTTPTLDGHYREYFKDVVHFNQRGREHLAALYFEGLRPLLTSHPALRCSDESTSSQPLGRAGRETRSSNAPGLTRVTPFGD